MNLLVIGNGGREHAIAWKLAQSENVDHVFVAPGNAGTAFTTKLSNIEIDPLNFSALIEFARTHSISFTVVGPESPLSQGIVDAFEQQNLLCLGPHKIAARLEASKAFAKDFMQENAIPTASYATFTDATAAKTYIRKQNLPIVIKADGLAGGKGVIIATTLNEATAAIDKILTESQFGSAGKTIVIEEFLQGTEASFIVLTDGKTIIPLASAADYKRRDTGNLGPNTGGMGAYSPTAIITPKFQQQIIETIIQPTLNAIAKMGQPYCGFLYAGLMIDRQQNPKVLEFNCRLGDPETQVILPRLTTDFSKLCLAALNHTLDSIEVSWNPKCTVGVVLAAKGYPEEYRKGDIIHGLIPSFMENALIFHAGTQAKGNEIVTNGGRVLCATALGDNLTKAKQAAYALVNKIHWDGMFYREDIAD